MRLWVRLTPRANRNAVDGIVEFDGIICLRVRVAAPPVDGAANAALVKLLAKRLRCPRRAISIEVGETARMKRLHIAGDPKLLAEALSLMVA